MRIMTTKSRFLCIAFAVCLTGGLLSSTAIQAQSPTDKEPTARTVKYAQEIRPMEFHVHVRGGMTPEKCVERQKRLGIRIGALENHGRGWPFDTDAKLLELIKWVKKAGLPVGIQVNDRDWFKQISPEVRQQLDYVLADTMIMPDEEGGEPKKMWLPGNVTVDVNDEAAVQAWMERYMKHCLQVVSEPITILANPTYLPPPLEKRTDLWTPQRMDALINAAVKNNVALEINAETYPGPEFIKRAKKAGAKFTIGVNNFTDNIRSYDRVWDMIEQCGLTADDFLRF